MVPDENVHFIRAFSIAQNGPLLTKANWIIPKGILEDENTSDFSNRLAEIQVEQSPALPAMGSPIMYIPQCTGILIGKMLNLPLGGIFYLGRFFNLFTWIILGYFSIKKAPIFKWSFFFLLVMPMSLYIAASFSYDVLSDSILILMVSIIIRMKFEKDQKLSRIDYCVLFLLSLLVGFTGKVNIFFPALVLIIPTQRFGSTKKKVYIVALSMLITLGAFISWSLYSLAILGDTNFVDAHLVKIAGSAINYQSQLKYVLAYPFSFFGAIFSSIRLFWFDYFQGFFGLLGWIDVPLPRYLYAMAGLQIILLILSAREPEKSVSISDRYVAIGIFTGSVALLFLILYLSFSRVGNWLVDGIQGRYFIPVFPLLLLVYYPPRRILSQTIMKALCPLFAVGAIVISLSEVYLHYYRPAIEYSMHQDGFIAPVGEIKKGIEVTETFTSGCNGMNNISLLLATYNRRNTQNLIFELRDNKLNSILETINIEPRTILNNKWRTVRFRPLEDSQGKRYSMGIKSPGSDSGNAFTIYKDSIKEYGYSHGNAFVNNKPIYEDLVIKYSCEPAWYFIFKP